MAKGDIICPVCGAANRSYVHRCQSCGASLDEIGKLGLSEEGAARKKNQQEGFDIKWLVLSLVVYLSLQAIFLVLLPLLVSSYDPQGLPGLAISAAVWLVGGFVMAFISPGKTFTEPVAAAALAVVPTVVYLENISDVHRLSLGAYIVSAIVGIMATLMGTYFGERIQEKSGRRVDLEAE